MKQLPNGVKWLIVLATLLGSGALLYYVNLRSGQADMPAPDWPLFTNTTASYPAAGLPEEPLFAAQAFAL